MAYSIDGNIVTITGACAIEDAEELHGRLCDVHEPMFDLAAATTLHTAVVQIILAAAGAVRNAPADAVLAACFQALGPDKDVRV